jgi:hypothetical protein
MAATHHEKSSQKETPARGRGFLVLHSGLPGQYVADSQAAVYIVVGCRHCVSDLLLFVLGR